MPEILKAWSKYLMVYADKSSTLFGTLAAPAPEEPWIKFDEPTWVSSLAVAIARKYKDAILVEELPVTKGSSLVEESTGSKGKSTDFGNADLWCCLNPTDKNDRFSFYLEAKFSPGARRKLAKHQKAQNDESLKRVNLNEVHNQIAKSSSTRSLLSRVFQDYQKSAGKKDTKSNFTLTSPHKNERRHAHVFLALLIKPVRWDDEQWPKPVNFSDMFPDRMVNVSYTQHSTQKNIYNFPSTGIILREKENGYGFIALVVMLGEA